MPRQVTTVDVTQETIRAASKASSSHCMIADAIREAIPEAQYVSVDLQTIRYTKRSDGLRYIYLTPPLAQRQLIRFDHGVVVEPWTLTLPSRPSQAIPIKSASAKPNSRNRPTTAGPKRLLRNAAHTVKGGAAPPLGLLAHSSTSGAGHKGAKRTFGLRATEFDPNR